MAPNNPQPPGEDPDIQRLSNQIAALQAKLVKKRAAKAKKNRKLDNRSKYLMGAFLQHQFEDPEFQGRCLELFQPRMDRYFTRPVDREVIDYYCRKAGLPTLPPRPDARPKAKSRSTEAPPPPPANDDAAPTLREQFPPA